VKNHTVGRIARCFSMRSALLAGLVAALGLAWSTTARAQTAITVNDLGDPSEEADTQPASRGGQHNALPILREGGVVRATLPPYQPRPGGRVVAGLRIVIGDSEGRTYRDLDHALAMDFWLLNR
jgi:hypothetical protein